VTTTANISGWGSDANYKFNGFIQDVAIYNGALSQARIQAHYAAGATIGPRRVNSLYDARGNPIASFYYNDDLATTRVMDGRGLNSYYTFQSYGGRTLSVTDTGGNTTSYVYDGGAAYRLLATVSPTGIRDSRIVNSGGPVGQQSQALVADRASQPASPTQTYVDGSIPLGSTLATSGENWVWDASFAVNPGRPSHRSTPVSGLHEHYYTDTLYPKFHAVQTAAVTDGIVQDLPRATADFSDGIAQLTQLARESLRGLVRGPQSTRIL
jgi:hypothetical protein